MRITGTILGCILVSVLSAVAQVPLEWTPVSPAPANPGRVHDQVVFDDGSGPAVWACGEFDQVAGGQATSGIAKFDGNEWVPVVLPLEGTILCMAVWDDGSGEALWLGGEFTEVGPFTSYRYLVRFDGNTVVPAAGTLNGKVEALVVHDDGSGPCLYAGGSFSLADGIPVGAIARFDGTSWAGLAGGVGIGLNPSLAPRVRALHTWDDGGGVALYVGGNFDTAGGNSAVYVARWDGTAWSALGSGLSSILYDKGVFAIHDHDDGSGDALYVGGDFLLNGASVTLHIARWDGVVWGPLGSGIGTHAVSLIAGAKSEVRDLATYDDGTGPALYVGGRLTDAGGVVVGHVARWSGGVWSDVAGGVGMASQDLADVGSLLPVSFAGTPRLFVGGRMTVAGGLPVRSTAVYDANGWASAGSGLGASLVRLRNRWGPAIRSMVVHDDGSGPALHVGGAFESLGGLNAMGVARWDGVGWTGVGSGLPFVRELAVADSGNGTTLHASRIGGVIEWSGAGWVPLGGAGGNAGPLAEFDSGAGPELFGVGGAFGWANCLERWDGSAWIYSGMLPGALDTAIYELAVLDDGSGARLYACGTEVPCPAYGSPGFTGLLAAFDGALWIPYPMFWSSGTTPGGAVVNAVVMYDDGTGPALHAFGRFPHASGVSDPVNNAARWTGSGWAPMAGGLDGTVWAAVVHDTGDGPLIYVGGDFTTPGPGLASWDGTSWSAVPGGFAGSVRELVVHDDGGGADLYVAGVGAVGGDPVADTLFISSSPLDSNVGAGVGVPVPVLAVSAGGAPESPRSYEVGLGQPFSLHVTQPAAAIGPAFALIVMPQAPNAATTTPTPLGTLGSSLPPSDGAIWLAAHPTFGAPLVTAGPTPWTLPVPPSNVALEFTVQGVIQDGTSPLGWSVTNGIVVRAAP